MNDVLEQLRLCGVSVNYGEVIALEGIHFQIEAGKSLALIGPNGAGKSTLLKSIAGLVPLNAGTIEWRHQSHAQKRKEIAYLAQRSEVDWNFPLTVRGLVEMGRYPHLGWWRRFSTRDHAVVDRALEKMRLTDLADRQISALSGGQQQRAFVARALAQEATVFLLDEPFTGLDRPSQELLTELFGKLTSEGHLVIASHHDLETVNEIFDEALLVNQRLISGGPVEESFTELHLGACFGGLKMGAAIASKDDPSADRLLTEEGKTVLTS